MATAAEGGESKFDPMHQFEVQFFNNLELAGANLGFTNSALWMVIAIVVVSALLFLGTMRAAMIPGRLQSIAEIFYEFIAGLMRDTIGPAGRPFFPFVFALFMYILFGNMLGMIPYSFTFTSHIAVTLTLAMIVFVMVTIVGLVKHGWHWFSFFVPAGVPKPLYVLLVPIEIISYLTRPIALSVRLFANMMAGHTVLKVIASFVPQMFVFGVLPLALVVAFTGLEFLIAFLQAYVFAILTCLYINDALHLH